MLPQHQRTRALPWRSSLRWVNEQTTQLACSHQSRLALINLGLLPSISTCVAVCRSCTGPHTGAHGFGWRIALRHRGCCAPVAVLHPAALTVSEALAGLQAVSAACSTSSELADVVSGRIPALYLPDPGALRAADAYSWGFVPPGTQSMLLQNTKPFGPETDTAARESAGRADLREGSSATGSEVVASGSTGESRGEQCKGSRNNLNCQ